MGVVTKVRVSETRVPSDLALREVRHHFTFACLNMGLETSKYYVYYYYVYIMYNTLSLLLHFSCLCSYSICS